MVVLGIDAHKRNHTVVAVDEHGRQLSTKTFGTTTADHLALLRWAEQYGEDRRWAVEDCRHLSRRLERDLLGAGEQVVRVAAEADGPRQGLRADLRQVRPDRRAGRGQGRSPRA
jgi:transposase